MLYLKGMRLLMFQLAGFQTLNPEKAYYRGLNDWNRVWDSMQ